MRPHYLQLTAFGPFADQVEIDFDRLGEGGLFLMHGETGAGKTTVLDGLSFALYGRVPGTRGVARLRSDHAAGQARTSVRLEVSVGGRRLRITRTPAQERPKKRGSGVTSEPASVRLEEWDAAPGGGGWRSRSDRVGEVDAELSELLGMSAEQFHQVVLLPQGQFARFLHSDAGERAQLLQRLFGTDRFRRIEDWLAEQRRQTREAFDEARHGVRRLVARIAQVCCEPEPEEVPGPDWLAGRLERAEEAASAAAQEAQAARVRQAAAEQAATQASDLARRQQRRQAALDRQRALETGASTISRAEAEIEAARRAAALVAPLEALTRQTSRAEQAQRAVEQARELLPDLLRASPIEQLRAAASAGREMLGRLTEAAQLERSIAATVSEAADLSQVVAAHRQRINELAPMLAAAPDERAAAHSRVIAAREAAMALPTAQAAGERAREALAAAKTQTARAADVARLSQEHLAARERAVELREAFQALRDDRIDGMIAELASTLVDDSPCPVCGALEHPDPSEVRGRKVSRDEEEAAATSAEAARDRASAIGEQLAAAQAGCDAAEGRLRELGCELDDVAGLRAAEGEARAAVTRLAAAAGDLSAAEDALAQQDTQVALRRDELTGLQTSVAASDRQLKASAKRQQELELRLTGLLAGAASVAQARQETTRLVESIEAAEAAAGASERAEAERAEADDRVEQAASAAGFGSVALARSAVRDREALQALADQVTRAQQESAAVAELLADPDLDVPIEPAAPVAETAIEQQRAREGSRNAEQRLATTAQQFEQLSELDREVTDRLRALEPVALAAQRAKELADLAAGQGANRLNMALSAYVLAARLEEVAEAASHRLRAMSQGRYTLVHSDAARGNGRSGLRLLVCDAWTGQDRDTATLSGGETFLASLALALGLAEVVTASAGGAPLEALFIDEGFGTLDEETLDEVLDVLDGLREGGRLVGIVSHVPNLRDRIPSQLRVRKGTAGSTLAQQDGLGPGDQARAEACADSWPPPVAAVGSAVAEPAAPLPQPAVVDVSEEPAAEQLALLGAD